MNERWGRMALILAGVVLGMSTGLIEKFLAYGTARLASRSSLLAFAQFTSPDPEHVTDARFSRYQVAPHHRLVAGILEEVRSGQRKRVILTMPPRHGKSELAVRKLIPWFWGNDPYLHFIVATNADRLALDHGRKVRTLLQSAEFGQVFARPEARLRADSQAMDRLETVAGGVANFVGRGASIQGAGADLLIIDDPIRGNKEARSQLIRDDLWEWFTEDILGRLMTDAARVIIIQTRWHEDDLVGRLTDPQNPHYDEEEAAGWTVIRLPALAEANDPLQRPEGTALWPIRFSAQFLERWRKLNPTGFAAVAQQRPAPEEGVFFKAAELKTYDLAELPERLRIYGGSDHAVSIKEENDRTALLCVGVDEQGVIWVLPDLVWDRLESDKAVEEWLGIMRRRKPLLWWAEQGQISKSLGPFLRKRMLEERVHVAVVELTSATDKQTRAQSIKGRAAMGMVRFPRFAPWWPDALHELLTFPNGTHDDFVDALSKIGQGLDSIVGADPVVRRPDAMPPSGTLDWVKWADKRAQAQNAIEKARKGY